MKRKFYSIVAAALALVGIVLFVNANEPSQAKMHKASMLKPHSHDRAPSNYNKARAPIFVSITRTDDQSNPQLIQLKGSITARRDFANLKVAWALPEDVEIVSGSAENIVNLSAGQSQTFEILLSSKTPENRQVYFNATNDESEVDRFGATAQYNTTEQEIIAKQLKENFRKARVKVRSGELRKIIFQLI